MENVTFKSVGDSCDYTLRPLTSGFGEINTIHGSRRRPRPKSGLILESTTAYDLGSLVELDIKFAGQEYTYRSKGIVSWIFDHGDENRAWKLGVTILGMDKLDENGISVSLREAHPELFQPTLPQHQEPEAEPAGDEPQETDSWTNVGKSFYPETPAPQQDPDPPGDMATWPTLGSLSPPPAEDISSALVNESAARSAAEESTDLPEDSPPAEELPREAPPPKPRRPKSPRGEVVQEIFDLVSMVSPDGGGQPGFAIEESFLPDKEELPEELAALLDADPKRMDLELDLGIVGTGRISVLRPRDIQGGVAKLTPRDAENLFERLTGEKAKASDLGVEWLETDETAALSSLVDSDGHLVGALGVDIDLLNIMADSLGMAIPRDSLPPPPSMLEEDDTEEAVMRAMSSEMPPVRVSRPPIHFAQPGEGSLAVEEKMVEAFQRTEGLYQTKERDEAAAYILALAAELIDCDGGRCALVAPEVFELYNAAVTGSLKEELLGKRIPPARGFLGFATRTGQVAAVKEPSKIYSGLEKETAMSGVRNLLVAPITMGERTLGALELVNSANPEGFSEPDGDLLAYLGQSLGKFLVTALLEKQSDS